MNRYKITNKDTQEIKEVEAEFLGVAVDVAGMTCEPEVWKGCYTGAFDLLTPESFAHPAKMSPALCFRIIEHLEGLGLLKPGAAILDPMGGTGLTAVCANAKGYKAVTVELEQKFIGFQRANKDYAGRRLGRTLDWTIIQGDSRKLSELLKENGVVTVTSPPYAEAIQDSTKGGIDWLVIGGQTRPDVMPKIEWVRDIVRAADAAGIPVWLKDNLLPLLPLDNELSGTSFYQPVEDGDHYQLRQERPR